MTFHHLDEPRHEKTCFCIYKNKAADTAQLISAFFRYKDRTIRQLPKYEISGL